VFQKERIAGGPDSYVGRNSIERLTLREGPLLEGDSRKLCFVHVSHKPASPNSDDGMATPVTSKSSRTRMPTLITSSIPAKRAEANRKKRGSWISPYRWDLGLS
jgi:hypothetical protein